MSVDKPSWDDVNMRTHSGGRQSKTRILHHSPSPVIKAALRTAILAELQSELERQIKAAAMAHEEAISEESQPENKWDTHSQEAAYLAEGQSRLVQEIRDSIDHYRTLALGAADPAAPVAVGAVVALEGAPGKSWYFLGPRSGGLSLQVEGREVLVVTPPSPLGRQLLGRRLGDLVSLPGQAGEIGRASCRGRV